MRSSDGRFVASGDAYLASNGFKKCTGCEATKPLTEFIRNRGKPDGYEFRCKTCRKAWAEARYAPGSITRDQRMRSKRDYQNTRYRVDQASQRRWGATNGVAKPQGVWHLEKLGFFEYCVPTAISASV